MIEMGMVNSTVTKELLESAQKENITEEETASKILSCSVKITTLILI